MMAYSGELPPEEFNMARYCLGASEVRPADKQALIVVTNSKTLQPAETWTYAGLEDAVLRIAAGLQALGLERGDRILIRLENTSDYALLFFGAIAGGFVPLPASAALSPREVTFFLKDSGAKAIALAQTLPIGEVPDGVAVLDESDIAALKSHPVPAPYAPTRPDDPAFLVYTSGSTANPKGVLHAHRSAWGRRPMYQGWYGISQDDRMLHAGAFNWTFTLGAGLTDPWANGATTVIYNGERDVGVWPRIIAEHQISLFAAVPGVYRQILKYCDLDKNQMKTLRHGLIAGEHVPPGLFEDWHGRTGTRLYEALGMSELSTYISSSPSTPPKSGAIGKPQQGRAIAILPIDGGISPVPPGQLGIIASHRSDPGLMLGYWNRTDEEADVFRGDWFLTGDLGVQDEDGYIVHHGRADDLMNAFGYRLSPGEIEQVLSGHPEIAEIAVTEIQLRPDLAIIGALVVPKDGARPTAQSIHDFSDERLASYKIPREFVFVDTLPRTPNGKIKRSELARVFQAAAAHG